MSDSEDSERTSDEEKSEENDNDDDEEKSEEGSEEVSNESKENVKSDMQITLETAIQLREHGKRLLLGMIRVHSLLKSAEYQIYTQPIKVDKKKGTVSLSKDKAAEAGGKLRYTYAVISHAKSFQQAAISTLSSLCSSSKDADYGWNFLYVRPILDLFTIYVKFHILMSHMPDLRNVITYYSTSCKILTKKEDPNAKSLSDWAHSRSSLKVLVSDLQSSHSIFISIFKSIVPSLNLILGDSTTFPWKMLNLIDKSEPSLDTETFFKTKYLCMMYLSDLCEAYLMFGLVYMNVLAQDAEFLKLFGVITTRQVVVHIGADFYIDISKVFSSFKKIKGRSADFNTSFIDNIEGNFKSKFNDNELRQRRIALQLSQFDSATNINASLLCLKYPILFSLLGFANYELKCSFRVHEGKPSFEGFHSDISELLYQYVSLTTKFLRAMPDVQRFFLYNLREYDANYLDTLAHSFTIPKLQYEKIEQLICALRTVDIAEFDNGKIYDLYPCQSVVRSIVQYFNSYSTSHGITHMTPLLYLIQGVGFRLSAYQETFDLVLSISQINTYWPHLGSLKALINDIKSTTSYCSISCMGVLHYLQYDIPAMSEIPELKDKITKVYTDGVVILHKIIVTQFKTLQEECYKDYRNQMSVSNIFSSHPEVAGEESKMANRNKHKVEYKSILKLSKTMMYAKELGILNICGEEHNISEELLKELGNLFRSTLGKEENVPPIEFFKCFETAKWAYQIFCNSSSINFQSKLQEDMVLISVVDDKIGPVAKMFKKKYEDLAKDVLPQAYYSNTLEMFTSDSNSEVLQYLTPNAFTKLQKIIGPQGLTRIYKHLASLFSSQLKQFIGVVNKLTYSEKEIEKGIIKNYPESEVAIKQWLHMSAVLQLRRMIQPFTDQKYQLPHQDEGLLHGMDEEDIIKLFEDTKFISTLAALFSTTYWCSFKFNVAHDAFLDNSHLLGNVLDALLGLGLAKKKTKKEEFYIEFFTRFVNTIKAGSILFKDNKKVDYPGTKLLIIMDQIVKNSVYADYAMSDSVINYQLIRTKNMERFNQFTKTEQKKEEGASPSKDKKKRKSTKASTSKDDEKAKEKVTKASTPQASEEKEEKAEEKGEEAPKEEKKKERRKSEKGKDKEKEKKKSSGDKEKEKKKSSGDKEKEKKKSSGDKEKEKKKSSSKDKDKDKKKDKKKK